MLPAILVFLSLILAPFIQAQVNPLYTNPTVTATVPLFASPSPPPPPDVPILISPTNYSSLNTVSPTFIFAPSTNVSIYKYELWIDGSLDTDGITPITANTISLPPSMALNNGQHTWKIRAVANNNRVTDSATWTFTIDTTAPIIMVTQVAEHSVNLSSQDPSTIPPGYQLTTIDHTPTIAGSSEANALIYLTFSSGQDSYSFTATADSQAHFSFTPDLNLSSLNYTVTIISSDQLGNTTILPDFNLNITGPASTAPAIVLPLPSPFKDLSFTLPFSPSYALPELPQSLTAYLITLEKSAAFAWIPWLIIISLLTHILLLIKLISALPVCGCIYINKYHYISLYITIILPMLILGYLAYITIHWLPAALFITSVIVIFTEKKIFTSKKIKPYQY